MIDGFKGDLEVNYSSWPRKNIRVESLLLDVKNPRNSGQGEAGDQSEELERLVANCKVRDLAKGIAHVGFLPNDSLVVIEEGNRKIVVEGNRRLAALKLLRNPDLAPPRDRAYFTRLSEKLNRDEIATVPCVFAPSRDAASPIIVSRHQGESVERWQPGAQTRYIIDLASRHSASELEADYGVSAKVLKEARETNAVRNTVEQIDLPADVLDIVRDDFRFSLSTLMRVMQSKPGQEYFRIKESAERGFVFGWPIDELKKPLGVLVTEVANGALDTRKLNTADDIASELKRIWATAAPDTESHGSFTPSPQVRPGKSSSAKTPVAAPTKPSSALWGTKPFPKGFRCNSDDKRIRDVFTEIQGLKLSKQINLAAIGMRVIVDLSFQHFARDMGIYADIEKRVGANKGDRAPSLSQLWSDDRLKEELKSLVEKQQWNALVHKMSSDAAAFSISQLNGFVHSSYHVPTEKDVQSFVRAFSGVLTAMWEYKRKGIRR